MPTLTAALPFIAIGGSLLGTGVTALSAMKQGQEQAAAYKDQSRAALYNQQVAEANAQQVDKSAKYWEEQERKKQLQLRGTQAAGYGGAGVMMEGSPLDVLAFTAEEQERDIIAGRWNYGVEAARWRNQGAFYGYESQRQGNLTGSALTTGYMKAGTALLSGLGNVAGAASGFKMTKYNKLTVPDYSSFRNYY